MATDVKNIQWVLSAVDRASPAFRGVESSIDRVKTSWQSLSGLFAAGAAGGGLVMLVNHAIEAGDQLNKLSQKIGVSVDDLSALKFAAQLADVEVGSFTRGMKGLNDTLVQAQDGTSKQAALLKALGVDIKAGPNEALKQVADAFKQLGDDEVKTTLAGAIFGSKIGIDMIPLLNQGRKGIDEVSDSARKLGLTFGAEFAQQAEQFNDNMKKLTTGGQKLGIMIAGEILPGLSSLTNNLANSAEKGNMLLGALKELLKLDLALFSRLFGGKGVIGGALDSMTESMFAEDGARPGWKPIRAANGSTPAAAAPNSEEISCALSGGKWVGGKCVRVVAGRKSDNRAERERDARAIVEGEEALAKEVSDAWDEYTKLEVKRFEDTQERMREEIALNAKMYTQEYENAVAWQEHMRKIDSDVEKTDGLMKSLGFTMSSAFEDAISKGKDMRTVLQGIAQDLIKILTRKFVSDPLGEFASAALKQSGIGSWFGGGYTPKDSSGAGSLLGSGMLDGNIEGGLIGSYAGGTSSVPRTGPYLLHAGESVSKAGEGGGHTFNITYNPSGAGGASDAQTMAANLIPLVKSVVRGEIGLQLRPGGVLT
jgi:hypothetical protein